MRSNIKKLAALLMAGAAMTACSNNDENFLEEVSQPDQPKVYTMTVEATKGDNGTRGLFLVDDYLKVKWDQGEEVYVMKWDNAESKWNEIGVLTAEASETASTTLNGTLTEAPEEHITKLFLHGTSVSYDNQQGTLQYIAENCDFATAMIKNIVTDETTNNITVSGIEFISQQAIVQFHLKDKEGNSLNVTKLKIEDGEGNMCNELNASTGNLQDLGQVNGSVEIDYIAGTGTMFVALSNVHDSKLKFTATVPNEVEGGQNAYTYVYEKTGDDLELEAGKYYDITVKMEKDEPDVPDVPAIDLSMVDCAGNERTNAWTANCYMVHSAGKYKLPLVYGNAIKAGAANTAAYNPGGTTSTNYCANFVNHAGQAITDPWIKNNGITVTSAELLWQDAQGLVTAVGIDGDYLTLTVGKNATAQEGNALIAAKAADDNIVWSWHIWVTKQTFATADLTDINTDNHTYSVTPVNLGWVGDATSTTGYCTFYQWGRKDAFIPSTGIGDDDGNSDNHTVYDINNNDVTTTAFSRTNDNSVTIGGNIQQPTVHNQNSTTKGPCDTQYYNMWDAQQTSDAENTAAATVKTVYDPCPPGFCVPTSGLYNYIASQTVTEFNKGYTYSGVFFPASGGRGFRDGVLYGVGSSGSYWSATPKGGDNGLYFDFGWLELNYGRRAMGCPVRAVAE